MFARLLCVVFVFSLCLFNCKATQVAGTPALTPNYFNKHAHNDYEQKAPLFDALEHGFESVEADVWWTNNDLGVSHQGDTFKGTLDSLYLKPLNDRIAEKGFVVKSGRPFYLWVDIKENKAPLRDAIRTQLSKYDIFTLFDQQGIVKQNHVTVILTGSNEAKRAMVDTEDILPFTRDNGSVNVDDPQVNGRWLAYAVQWPLVWDGHSAVLPASREILDAIVTRAHEKGRLIRFWSAPDTYESWSLQRQIKADFIGADNLDGLVVVVPN